MNSLAKLHVIMMCMEKFEFCKILLVRLYIRLCVCVHMCIYAVISIYTCTYLCSVLSVCRSAHNIIQLRS